MQGFGVVSGAVGKPNLPGLGLRRLLFLKLTPMVRFPNRTYRVWGKCGITDACEGEKIIILSTFCNN